MIKLTLAQSLYSIGPLTLTIALPATIGASNAGEFLGHLALSGLIAILINLSFDGFIQREILHGQFTTARVLIGNRLRLTLMITLVSAMACLIFPRLWIYYPVALGAVAISLSITAQGALRVSHKMSRFFQFGVLSNLIIPTACALSPYAQSSITPDILFSGYACLLAIASFIYLCLLISAGDADTSTRVDTKLFYIEGLMILPHTVGLYLLLWSDRLGLTFLKQNSEVTEVARASLPAAAAFALIAIVVGPFTKHQFSTSNLFNDPNRVGRVLLFTSLGSSISLLGIGVLLRMGSFNFIYSYGLGKDFLTLCICYLFVPLSSLVYSVIGGQLFMQRDGRWYAPLTVSIGTSSIVSAYFTYLMFSKNLTVFPLFICLGYSILSFGSILRARLKWSYKKNTILTIPPAIVLSQVVFILLAN